MGLLWDVTFRLYLYNYWYCYWWRKWRLPLEEVMFICYCGKSLLTFQLTFNFFIGKECASPCMAHMLHNFCVLSFFGSSKKNLHMKHTWKRTKKKRLQRSLEQESCRTIQLFMNVRSVEWKMNLLLKVWYAEGASLQAYRIDKRWYYMFTVELALL